MPTASRRVISYTSRMVASPLSRYGALILLVALIFALYFIINHQVSKPYGTGPSIISEYININSTYFPDASGSSNLGGNFNMTNQTTYDQSTGNVQQYGNFSSQIYGFPYDRGDGCSRINYTDTSNTKGSPRIPLPAQYRKFLIGIISADTSNCSISKKISNSVSDNDIAIIFWASGDQDLPDSDQINAPVFYVDSNTSSQLRSGLQNLYKSYNTSKNKPTEYRVMKIEMVPFQPLSPNFWLVSMISVAGVLVLSFFVSVILHVKINRGRMRRIEQARMQRSNEESMGMKKWTLDKEVVGTFPVIIYSRKITSTETDEEKKPSESATNEGKEEASGVENTDDDGADEQSQHKLRRKSSTRSTRSQRSEKAVSNAVVLYSSQTSQNTDTAIPDHISESETRETCAICLEDFDNGDEIRELPCRHWYHVECIDPWLTTKSSSCPLCKKDCKPENVDGIAERNTEQERESQASRVIDNQNQPPSSSSSTSSVGGVMQFVNRLFRPSQRSRRQRGVADERGGEESSHSEMEGVHTSENV